MRLNNYSERSFVIFGEDTENHKELIKSLGGKWNRNLTHPITGERFRGWIFSNRKLNIVSETLREYMIANQPAMSSVVPSAPPAPVEVFAPLEVIEEEMEEEMEEEIKYPVKKKTRVFSNVLFMCFVFALCYVIG
jgi:hypothetical protein